MLSSWLILVFGLMTSASGQTELFKNPDFELPYDGQNNWWGLGCTLGKSTDAYRGSYSGQITNRQDFWAGLAQYVPVQPNRRYAFSARVKLLNQLSGMMRHFMKSTVLITYTDGAQDYKTLGESPYMMLSDGWIQVGGDMSTDSRGISQARFYIEFQELQVNYLVDSASFTEVTLSPIWREEADLAIELFRKRDLEIRLVLNPSIDPMSAEIEVELLRHEFAFGSAVNSNLIVGTDTTSRKYQETYYGLFEWAVLENALKWKQMEPVQGTIDYAWAENAINALRSQGILIRGHCVTWGVEQNVPDWLKPMDGNQVRAEVTKRIDGVVNRFKGRLEHWDVNNEVLQGPFFENKTADPWYTEQMFREVHGVDGDVKLFFNDYNIVNYGVSTHAYRHQIEHAQLQEVPVYGIGIQSHQGQGFDIGLISHRLSVMSSLGLPIWITELDYPDANRTKRADAYEDLLRLYFSHPSIEGVMVWGFWDGAHWKPEAALAEGPNIVLNEAGLRYRQLVKETWSTHVSLNPSNNVDVLNTRGFHGDYRLTVKVHGVAVKTIDFTMPSGEGTFSVEVDV